MFILNGAVYKMEEGALLGASINEDGSVEEFVDVTEVSVADAKILRGLGWVIPDRIVEGWNEEFTPPKYVKEFCDAVQYQDVEYEGSPYHVAMVRKNSEGWWAHCHSDDYDLWNEDGEAHFLITSDWQEEWKKL